MSYKIIIPAVNEQIADKCLESIYPDIKNDVILIDNSVERFAQKYGVEYEHHPENIGISRAWNIGAHRVVNEKLDYLIILSSSVIFEQGMIDLIDMLNKEKPKSGIMTQHGWHLLAISRNVFETIGFFDENFYPAYYEDSDFIRRMELANIHQPVSEGQRFLGMTVSSHIQGIALGLKSGVFKVNFDALRSYFLKKWGDDSRYASQKDRDRMFKYPFNNPDLPLSYWEQHTVQEMKEKYAL